MQKPAGELPPVGDYEVVETLQADGLSSVHRAVHPRHEGELILKVARRARDLGNEIAILQKLATPGHRNVVQLVDFGQTGELGWHATRRVAGPTLFDLLHPKWGAGARSSGIRRRSGPEALRRSLLIVYELARALSYIHHRGIVHADVSPANVLLRDGDRPVLVDFGAAREQEPWDHEIAERPAVSNGTPGYVAPERLRQQYWDTRADIYSLGCIWYELVTGRPVFWATDEQTLTFQHLEATPLPASHWLAVRPEMTEAIAATLRKQPHERTPTAELIASFLSRELGLSDGSQTPQAPRLFRSRAFGRERERAQVRFQLRAAGSGTNTITLVVGTRGAGKSRLLSDAQEEAMRLGFRVQTGLNPVDSPTPTPPASMSTRAPLALFIDDAERLSTAARHALLHAARSRTEAQPVALTLSWSQEAPIAPELEAEGILRVHVGALSRAATAATLSDTLAQPCVDPDLVAAVFRASLGNPRALHEYVADLARFRLLELRDGAWAWPAPKGDQPKLTWERPIRKRASLLSEGAKHLACVVAVLGDSFTLSELEALLQNAAPGDAATTTALVAELEASKLLWGTGKDHLRFASASYRAVFEDMLAPIERARLHLSRAANISPQPRSSDDSLRLGLHHAAIASPKQSIRHLRAAAKAAASNGFIQQAIHALEIAWTEAQRLLDAAPERQAVNLRVGYALLLLVSRAADHHGLRELAKQLLALSGDGHRLLRAKIHRLWAVSLRITAQYAEAQHHLALGLAILGRPSGRGRLATERERIRNRIAAAWTHYAARDGQATQRIVEEVLPLARRVGTPSQLADTYMWRANALALRRGYAFSRKAVAYERRAVALERDGGTSRHKLALFRFDLAFMLLLGGRAECREAVEHLESALASSSDLLDVTLLARVTTYLAIAYRRTGQVERCADLVERALEQAQQCDQQGYVGAARACRAWLFLRRGEQGAAKVEADAAVAVWSRLRAQDPSRRSEYPFQWLALIPQLALTAAEERTEPCSTIIADLLNPSQARLAHPVRRELAAASGQLRNWPLATQLSWLDRFLPLAARHRYL